MKKMFAIIVAIVTMTMTAYGAYPSGSSVGVSLGGSADLGGGIGLSGLGIIGQFEGFPIMLGASFGLWRTGFAVNVTGDWWGLQKEIGRAGDADVLMYLGPGASVTLGIATGDFSADLGIRMPIGFSWMVDKPEWEKWEIFTEAIVGANLVGFYSSDAYTGVTVLGLGFGDNTPSFNFFRAINLGVNVGFRHWF